MKFLLPSRIPQFDFQFQLMASQDFWTNFKNSPLTLVYADDSVNFEQAQAHGKWNDYCPVGSIEFCRANGIETRPWNIPVQLQHHACSEVVSDIANLTDGVEWHVKGTDHIKDPRNGVYSSKAEFSKAFGSDGFQATRMLPDGFLSEWRVFVMDGNIIDIQNYAGDFWKLPDRYSVERMIFEFEHAKGANPPPAYTLDVGVVDDGRTCVVEVHDFYACGTYSMNDHYHYPLMLWNWWHWHRKTR